jgi:hypothetical protein
MAPYYEDNEDQRSRGASREQRYGGRGTSSSSRHSRLPFVGLLLLARTAGALTLLGSALGAQFTVDDAKIPSGSPFNDSSTENVDFADIDLDGDWDVAAADGGDDGNDQNRIWVNQGGLQAGELGLFADETAARAPAVLDDSRDIEFVDFDEDGDPDVNVSNTAQAIAQTNRWWTNQGGVQAGGAGFYTDETAQRWVGLGGPGSSVAPAMVLGTGGFIDWSGDSDFGDLDMDGDLDLVHTSYGGAFGGQVPTRLFLNDGLGFFSEFNPSGFQLFTDTIAAGQPGLWCDGLQQSNALDATGQFCDIATTGLDVDLGDIDGDFDLDLLLGARQEPPRMFANRLEASGLAPDAGGGLAFRDVTGAAFSPGYATGAGHYAQEFGDLDGDGDLDILGVNWVYTLPLFNDVTLENDATGHFGELKIIPGSGADDTEGDLLDYDGDGDFDLYMATFTSFDRLYRNDIDGGTQLSFTPVLPPAVSKVSLDADACDTDGDGDYDLLVAEDNHTADTFLRNTTEVPDGHGPSIPMLEQLADAVPIAGERTVRAHVYDNAPYYITWYNPTWLLVEVDGVALPEKRMQSSAGQLFRGALEANLLGTVVYRVRSEDEHGNAGFSAALSYDASGGPAGTLYGAKTPGSFGPPTLRALSLPLAGEMLYIAAGNMPAGTACFISLSTGKAPSSIDLGSGFLLQLALPPILVAPATADGDGYALLFGQLPADIAGMNLFSEVVSLDGAGGNVFATSQGLELAVH